MPPKYGLKGNIIIETSFIHSFIHSFIQDGSIVSHLAAEKVKCMLCGLHGIIKMYTHKLDIVKL